MFTFTIDTFASSYKKAIYNRVYLVPAKDNMCFLGLVLNGEEAITKRMWTMLDLFLEDRFLPVSMEEECL